MQQIFTMAVAELQQGAQTDAWQKITPSLFSRELMGQAVGWQVIARARSSRAVREGWRYVQTVEARTCAE